LKRKSIICDLGAGKGSDTIYFLKKGHTVIAVDISDTGLEVIKKIAKEKGLDNKLTSYQADLNDLVLPIKDNSVDYLYSRLTTHYFSLKDTIAIFREIYRILKPGGKTIITVKSSEDKIEMDFLKSTAKEVEPGVYLDTDGILKNRFTLNQWRTILNNAEIAKFSIGTYLEDLSGKIDKTKSGNKKLLLTEIRITK
jgi:ubiquinone/menaquinone biosynthesis C-methylase UbiE